ncbi:hypothetical protein [Streptomyces sp. NPDC093544]|uniref:hypothetical protein n=1 Tax=Streptomyces sp. NPDC093544 TaxID=3155200 RepID=UPI00343BC8CB
MPAVAEGEVLDARLAALRGGDLTRQLAWYHRGPADGGCGRGGPPVLLDPVAGRGQRALLSVRSSQ